MKICVVSDSHDSRRLFASAVEDARARGAEALIHCGDIVAPTTLRAALKAGLPMHVVHGNNMGDVVSLARLACEPDARLTYHGADGTVEFARRRIFFVHYPHYAYGMALTGDYDLVCCGHDHRPEVKQVANIRGSRTWLVNPGTVGGVGNPPTYLLVDLAEMRFEILPVPVPDNLVCNLPRVVPHD